MDRERRRPEEEEATGEEPMEMGDKFEFVVGANFVGTDFVVAVASSVAAAAAEEAGAERLTAKVKRRLTAEEEDVPRRAEAGLPESNGI